MDQVIAKYLASKAVQDIRSDFLLPSDLCYALNRFPIIDYLRAEIQTSDWQKLHKMCESSDEEICALGLALLRRILRLDEVRSYLEKKYYDIANLPFKARISLQYKLLDYPDLEHEIQKELFESILEDWESWLATVADWTGGQDNVLEYCRLRLRDPNFPKTKHWIYICAAAASDNPKAAQNLIHQKKKENRKDAFMQKVIEEVLNHVRSVTNLTKRS